MLVGLVQHDAAVRLGPVFAALVITVPPEHIKALQGGSVLLEVVLPLRPEPST